MKHNEFFKHNFSFQQKISSVYNRQALQYQFEYNKKHPDKHIWRHLLYRRTFYFLRHGVYFSVQIEIVRFKYAGTNSTFTFYGDLFLAFSRFSSQFVRQAVSEGIEGRCAASIVSKETLKRWSRHLSLGLMAPTSAKEHKPGTPHTLFSVL